MALVWFALIGAFIGWLAAAIEEVDEGVFARIGIGMVGAMVGVLIAALFDVNSTMTNFSWTGVLFSVVGAVLLVGVVNRSSDYEPHDASEA